MELMAPKATITADHNGGLMALEAAPEEAVFAEEEEEDPYSRKLAGDVIDGIREKATFQT